MFCLGEADAFSGRVLRASSIGNDFTDGHLGMARAVRGAKKFINRRRRFHERITLQRRAEDDN
jgi:hypothetical protein